MALAPDLQQAYDSLLAVTAGGKGRGYGDIENRLFSLEAELQRRWGGIGKRSREAFLRDLKAQAQNIANEAAAKDAASAAATRARLEAEAQKRREDEYGRTQAAVAAQGVLSPQDYALVSEGVKAGKTDAEISAEIEAKREQEKQRQIAEVEEAITAFQGSLAPLREQATAQVVDTMLRRMPSTLIQSGALQSAVGRAAPAIAAQEAEQVARARLAGRTGLTDWRRGLTTMGYQDATSRLAQNLAGQYRGEERGGDWLKYQQALLRDPQQATASAMERFALAERNKPMELAPRGFFNTPFGRFLASLGGSVAQKGMDWGLDKIFPKKKQDSDWGGYYG